MTGKEIVRLIHRLKKEGMSSSKILDIIEEVAAPELKDENDSNEGENETNN